MEPTVVDGAQIGVTQEGGPPELREQPGPSAVCQSCNILFERGCKDGRGVGFDGYMMLEQQMAAGIVCILRKST